MYPVAPMESTLEGIKRIRTDNSSHLRNPFYLLTCLQVTTADKDAMIWHPFGFFIGFLTCLYSLS